MAQPASTYKTAVISRDPWASARSTFGEPFGNGGFSSGLYMPSSLSYPSGTFTPQTFAARAPTNGQANPRVPSTASTNSNFVARPSPMLNAGIGPNFGSYQSSQSSSWEHKGRYSPTGSLDDIMASPNLSDYSPENGMSIVSPRSQSKANGKRGSQRRPSNRDEFDGPHQFLQRPPQEVITMQERELPHLPTNLHVQEQDDVLTQVNERLSQCAYDFVAKYQFPIPLTQDMRPVERPQDREWTEWVYLLKRLATKRRIPARVLYNGQIKQFVTILENSLEMRHAAKHQSRPLKDDRNILQLISAGLQVAKILKDASAMEYLDRLYVDTEKRIQERAASRFRP
ncbi:hypothetical protein HIM_07664 [Hirsutella minnesotensis 3608]|uniref:Uncharacterized protein n=1 Tax=Hirsutella minnesotensis 3608 TaxID=1043627 RepID=A0A0F7ZHM5_9HYPO|nr:hypothetical protein HIM_07664 [Hirsutella minnesotensis 3608]